MTVMNSTSGRSHTAVVLHSSANWRLCRFPLLQSHCVNTSSRVHSKTFHVVDYYVIISESFDLKQTDEEMN